MMKEEREGGERRRKGEGPRCDNCEPALLSFSYRSPAIALVDLK